MSTGDAEEVRKADENSFSEEKSDEQQLEFASPEHKTRGLHGAFATDTKTKICLLMKPAGDAPIMKKKKWTVDPSKRIGSISEFLKNYLKLEASESIFLYVNQSFSPAPDTEAQTLFECFGSDGKLVLHYCKSAAWG